MIKNTKTRFSIRSGLSLIIGVIALLAMLVFIKREAIFEFLSEATGEPANLVVQSQFPLGELPRPWAYLGQGGEDLSGDMIAPVVGQAKALSPRSIRIDHIFDGYDVVSKNESGQLSFNWTRLDAIVNSIRQTGATPMLSLSYMPPAISSGSIVDPPRDWNDWALVVQRTIEHYSGNLGIADIAYEVWNEPDLFGNWKTYGERNYLVMYQYAALGASRAKNVKSFKIGGPATTAPYDNWVDNFLKFVADNNLRIDFYSWHRYAKDPAVYLKDRDLIDGGLQRHLGLAAGLERYVTEWGPNSENDPAYDGMSAAAQLVAMIRASLGQIDRMYTFEIIDGKNADGQEFWGRWGLITHPSAGAKIKPRYQALQFLNKLSGIWLNVTGEGDWVKAIPVQRADGSLAILVVNYDWSGRHREDAPLTISGLASGTYTLSRSLLGGGTTSESVAVGADGLLATTVSLLPNNIILIEVTK